MLAPDDALLDRYAELLVRLGLNVQPGQGVHVTAEPEHAPFVHRVAAAAYRAGAAWVHVGWQDVLLARARLQHAAPEHLDYFPAYETARLRQMLDEGWPRLALVGPQHPTALDGVDAEAMRRSGQARSRATRFYGEAMSANRFAWCVAAVPTAAWAQQVFPGAAAEEAVAKLWALILHACRVDRPDPIAAWQEHDAALRGAAAALEQAGVVTLRFVAPPASPGAPATDLTVGLTPRPKWVGSSSLTPAGLPFFPNIPTEEIFTTPDSRRAEGFVAATRPTTVFGRRVEGAWFRFAGGEVAEFGAAEGADVLEQHFALDGARRLGEAALVDVRSPLHAAGVLFHEILLDENAACHIAFGEAYPEGVQGGLELSAEELAALGVNRSETHLDVMIGSPTMDVTGYTADGREVAVMREGRFVVGEAP